MKKQERILLIDIIRVLGVFWVAGFWHLMGYCSISVNTPILLAITRIFLASFVFISGLLIGKKKLTTTKEIIDFFIGRFAKIYIPLVFACALALVDYLAFDTWIFKNWNAFWRTLGGISSIIGSPVSTLWFISMMLILYLITPLLLRRHSVKSILFSGLIIWVLFVVLHFWLSILDYRIIIYFPFYVLGIIWNHIPKESIDAAKKKFLLVDAVLLLIFFRVINHMEDSNGIHVLSALLGLPMVYLISEILHWCLLKIRKIVEYLGEASICIYLFHRQIYTAISKISGIREGEFSLAFAYIIAFPIVVLYCVLLSNILKGLSRIVYEKMKLYIK